MSCDDCLNRRSFLARSAAAATAAALAACGDGQIGGPGVTGPSGGTTVTVADFPGLATVGQLVAVDSARVVKRTGTSSFEAYSRTCTHEGTAVDVINNGTRLHCFNHGSEFDANGNVLVGPAARRLTVLSTSFNAAAGTLTIG